MIRVTPGRNAALLHSYQLNTNPVNSDTYVVKLGHYFVNRRVFAHVISAAKKLTSRARPDWVAEYPNASVDFRLTESRCSFTHFP